MLLLKDFPSSNNQSIKDYFFLDVTVYNLAICLSDWTTKFWMSDTSPYLLLLIKQESRTYDGYLYGMLLNIL